MRRRRGCASVILGIVLVLAAGAAVFSFVSDRMGGKDTVSETYQSERESVPFQSLSIEETDLEQKYYYQILNEEDRTIYKEILQGVKDTVKEIYVHSNDADKVNRIYRSVLADYPELFWCSGNAGSTGYNQSGEDAYCVFEPEYTYTGDELSKRKQQIEAAAAECLSGMVPDGAEYDKIKYIYEYIINTTDYNMEASDNQNIFSVLVNKESVCAGYAKTFQYLLEKAGVFVTYVTGTVNDNQAHAWNLVKCQGEYYYVDSTWGDPVFLQEEGERPDKLHMNYDYLLCDDKALFATHTPDKEVVMPACTSTQYNYYVLNGSYYKDFDREQIKSTIFQSINDKRDYVDFKFAEAALYQEAKKEIIGSMMEEGARYLGQRYGLSSVSYYYQEADSSSRMTLYWNYGNN